MIGEPTPKEGIDVERSEAGPVDVVVLRFPGNQFNGGIAPALRDLVERGLVRVLDLLFVYKDVDGTVGSIELGDLGPELEPAFVDLDGQLGGGLLDAEDVEDVGGAPRGRQLDGRDRGGEPLGDPVRRCRPRPRRRADRPGPGAVRSRGDGARRGLAGA